MPHGLEYRRLWGVVFPRSHPKPTPNVDAMRAERRPGRCGICDEPVRRLGARGPLPIVCQQETGRDCYRAHRQLVCSDYEHRARLARDTITGALVAWMRFTGRRQLPSARPLNLQRRPKRERPSRPAHAVSGVEAWAAS